VLHAVRQHLERYLRLEANSAPAYRYESPLTEEEIALLEEEVLPVIASFIERSEAAAEAAERAEQERLAPEPTLATAERQRQGWGQAA
jgi:hypothetical protein